MIQRYDDTEIRGYRDTMIQRYENARILQNTDTRIQRYTSLQRSTDTSDPIITGYEDMGMKIQLYRDTRILQVKEYLDTRIRV